MALAEQSDIRVTSILNGAFMDMLGAEMPIIQGKMSQLHEFSDVPATCSVLELLSGSPRKTTSFFLPGRECNTLAACSVWKVNFGLSITNGPLRSSGQLFARC
jgi:hypothetical protein